MILKVDLFSNDIHDTLPGELVYIFLKLKLKNYFFYRIKEFGDSYMLKLVITNRVTIILLNL